MDDEDDNECQRDLDLHANMIVCCEHCWIISCYKRSIDVNIFSCAAGGLSAVQIFDAFITYQCFGR